MIRPLLVCLMSCIFALPALSDVIETDSMEIALQDARPGDLVLFDLDNTLWKLPHMAGTDQWFDHMLREAAKIAPWFELAHEATRTLFMQIHSLTRVIPVEEATPELIRELQRREIMAMALTARPERYLELTNRNLKEIGVDFTQSPLPRVPNRLGEKVSFHNGVIYTAGSHKGEALLRFLEAASINPYRVKMIDDKAKNLTDVGSSVRKQGIQAELWRYTRTDHYVSVYDPAIALIQVDQLHKGRVLSDEEARSLLPSYQPTKQYPHAILCLQLFM